MDTIYLVGMANRLTVSVVNINTYMSMALYIQLSM